MSFFKASALLVLLASASALGCGLKTGNISANDPKAQAALKREEILKRESAHQEEERPRAAAPKTAFAVARKEPPVVAPPAGCGYRKLEIASEKSGGAWGAPVIAKDDEKYTASHCNNVPDASWIPASFTSEGQLAAKRCGSAARIMFDTDKWAETPARRSVTVMCWSSK